MSEEFIKVTDRQTDTQTELLPELLSELKKWVVFCHTGQRRFDICHKKVFFIFEGFP